MSASRNSTPSGSSPAKWSAAAPIRCRSKSTAAQEIQETNARLEQANQALRSRTQQLEASNRELEAFSYSLSHDLRTPLRTIDGFSLAVMEDCAGKLDSRDLENLNRVRAGAQRMAQLIDDMLNLSRVTRRNCTGKTSISLRSPAKSPRSFATAIPAGRWSFKSPMDWLSRPTRA